MVYVCLPGQPDAVIAGRRAQTHRSSSATIHPRPPSLGLASFATNGVFLTANPRFEERPRIYGRPSVEAKDGLSLDFPEDREPVNLERGPTPLGPSFVQHRFSVMIASSTAGANSADAAKSYDDDETTSWSNAINDAVTDGLPPRRGPAPSPTGSLETAWIEYNFAEPETVGEVELKLNGFRQRRYPLRITLDENKVWEGLTPTTLGFCTLKLAAPARGSKLRITLTAPPVDASMQVTELNGKLEAAIGTPLGKPGNSVLSVIEVEIYKSGTALGKPNR